MENKKVFYLRDYLRPGGTRPYKELVPDLEAAFNTGCQVELLSVPNQHMLFGHPELKQYVYCWSDGTEWYKSAKDCLDRKNGILGDY